MGRKPWLLLISMFCLATIAAGQILFVPHPESKLTYDRGATALKQGNAIAAFEFFRQAVIRDLDWIDPLEALVKTAKSMRGNMPSGNVSRSVALRELRALFETRAREAPANSYYLWAIALLDDSTTQEIAESRLRAAIAIDPNFFKAYERLANVLAYRGDLGGELDCLRAMRELQPQDPEILATYAMRALESDPRQGRLLTDQFLATGHSAAGAELLARLAAVEPDLDRRIEVLERLKSYYPVTESDTSEWNMQFLFDAYNRTEPTKALALAQEMVLLMPRQSAAGRDWKEIASYEEALTRARSFLEHKAYNEAIRELNKAVAPDSISIEPEILLRAEGLQLAGKTDQAYKAVLSAAAAQPSEGLKAALALYGKAKGKSDAQIEADIHSAMVRQGYQFPSFTVYDNNLGKVKLSSFRGRVVLLDFWHPGMAEARADLPYLATLLARYESRGFAVVAVNVHPEDEIFRILMSRYRFASLSAPDAYWARREFQFNLTTTPYYYLLDRKGCAVYVPQFGRIDYRRSFELALEALLAQ
jgi:tetratricopeptide (TPR) repeat protein